MKCYALWNGGSSYANPQSPEDIEVMPSIEYAINVFADRFADSPSSYRGPFGTPCVDRDSEMWILFEHPGMGDPYPDRIIKFGPRNGIRVERG